MRPTSAGASSRSRRPTTRPASDAASSGRDILMATEGNPQATIVGDLTDAPQIPSDAFDCAIVTQTLQFVYDVRAALATLHRILAPGGVLLATVPGHHEDLAARGRAVRRVVALHRPLRAAARGRGVRRRGTWRPAPTETC